MKNECVLDIITDHYGIVFFVQLKWLYGTHAHDVMAAILVFQNNETSAMLVHETNPLGVQLFSYVNTLFGFIELLDVSCN